ncbi:MAG TPA: hypothetical protein PKD53_09870 [Chloroflexaceae bacterium]|nr:hypothetical protein [Chloroflexaceae bacterium]
MEMPETIFAALIGIGTLMALVVAARVWGRGEAGRQAATGWLIFAAAGAIQVVNLLTGYNVWLAILTTVAMGVGLWMGRGTVRRV